MVLGWRRPTRLRRGRGSGMLGEEEGGVGVKGGSTWPLVGRRGDEGPVAEAD